MRTINLLIGILLPVTLCYGQMLYSDNIELCDKKTVKLYASYDKEQKQINVSIGDGSPYLESFGKNKNDKDIKASIENYLKSNDSICLKKNLSILPIVANISSLIYKRKDITVPSETRNTRLDKTVTISEYISPEYIYQIKLNSNKKQIDLLSYSDKKYSLNVPNIKNEEIFTDNLYDILNFIKENEEIKIPYYLTYQGMDSYLVFNAKMSSKSLAGGDFVKIKTTDAVKYQGELLGTTSDNNSVFAFNIIDNEDKSLTNNTSTIKSSITTTTNQNMYGISFVIGLGGVVGFNRYYQMPVIDPMDKKVKLDQAQPSGLNASIGIVYTPSFNPTKSIGDVNRGWSFAAFFNPLNIASSSGTIQDTFSIENFGIGAGWKTLSGLSFFLTMEAFSIKQPRQWFIEKYKDNNLPYILQVDGQPQTQTSIDANDNNIFEKKYILGIGIKICYTFDIVKATNNR